MLVPGFASHLEFDWEEPRHAAFLERLASFSRLIRLDKRGTGLSDRHGGVDDLETRMDDVRAVMDAVGTEHAAVFGYHEGGPMSMLFAATYPERTRALALFGTYAVAWIATVPEERRNAIVDDVIQRWGDGTSILRFWPDADDVMQAWWGARERLAGSPGAIRNIISGVATTDVGDVLPAIQTPTIVLHSTDDPMYDVGVARDLAARIPSARLVELPGRSTLPWAGVDGLLDEIEEFLTGARPAPVVDRVLATILFTDIVGSTDMARSLGDAAWSRLVEQHHSAVRRELDRHTGEEIDTAGDGFFAVFDGPARAIRCALGIQAAVSGLGLGVRAGLHTGEVERVRRAASHAESQLTSPRASQVSQAGGETLRHRNRARPCRRVRSRVPRIVASTSSRGSMSRAVSTWRERD